MNKSITIISLNYYPEDTAIGLYSTQMAEYLHSKRWNVTVITGFPYYPQWEIANNYKNKKSFIEENNNGIRILRYKQFVPNNPTFIKRILHIVDFTLGSIFNLKKIKHTDIVLSVIPFTSSAWLGEKLAKRLHAKHWIHIQDFEFDAAFESGIAKKNKIINFIAKKLFKLEQTILNNANIVSTISNGMLLKLSEKSNSNRFYFPNWVDNSAIDPDKSKQHAYLNSDKFKILYSGNIGAKQDWDFFKSIAAHYQNDNRIEFIIVGDGALKSKLVADTKSIKNVLHFNPIPFANLNDLLCATDLHILFQKSNVIDTVMPSKILGMMASAKPSLVTGNLKSEVAKVFEISKGGTFIEASNVKKVIESIEKYISHKNIASLQGENAQKYILNKFSKTKVLSNFEMQLKKMLHE